MGEKIERITGCRGVGRMIGGFRRNGRWRRRMKVGRRYRIALRVSGVSESRKTRSERYSLYVSDAGQYTTSTHYAMTQKNFGLPDGPVECSKSRGSSQSSSWSGVGAARGMPPGPSSRATGWEMVSGMRKNSSIMCAAGAGASGMERRSVQENTYDCTPESGTRSVVWKADVVKVAV